MKRARQRIVIYLLVAAIAVFGAWAFWPTSSATAPEDERPPVAAPKSPAGSPQGGAETQIQPLSPAVPQPAVTTDPVAPPKPAVVDAAEVVETFRNGLALLKSDRYVEARTELSAAYASGLLGPQDEAIARKELTALADMTILSRTVLDDDPYTGWYKFKSGDVLQRVERQLALRVPTQILLKINRIADASKIRADQAVKIIRGPFHAIVSKSSFTMDVFLQRDDLPRVFVKRLPVGLGRDDSTPAGMWQVGLGQKMIRAPWNPPPNALQQQTILWGAPGYPLGKEGYWIGLEGMDENTSLQAGYGIHGTNEPDSIGKAASLGCVRMADGDIETAFFLLYEKWSTVEIRP